MSRTSSGATITKGKLGQRAPTMQTTKGTRYSAFVCQVTSRADTSLVPRPTPLVFDPLQHAKQREKTRDSYHVIHGTDGIIILIVMSPANSQVMYEADLAFCACYEGRELHTQKP